MKKSFSTLILLLFCFMASAHIDFIPQPNKVVYGDGTFLIEKGIVLDASAADSFNVGYLKDRWSRVFDFCLSEASSSSNVISFKRVAGMKEEEYGLNISKDGIFVESSTRSGEFYAIQTLLQMLPAGVYADVKGASTMLLKEWSVPFISIEDSPRFSYRGNMFDVSRTFFPKEFIIRQLDYLAYHKINKFHWHLTDDNGWRIEIKSLPKLTKEGCFRGEDDLIVPSFFSGKESYGGFYTQEEIKYIVKYAKERNIEIIPEIDLPGHSKAFASAYPEIICNKHDSSVQSVQQESGNVFCVGKESNFVMLEKVVKEMSKLFDSEYIHIGGDEVALANWKNCDDCQALMKREGLKTEKELLNYFANRMGKILAKYGKKLAGWEEIVESGDLDPDARVYAWRNSDLGVRAVKRGQPTIMQIGKYCYFDMKYSPIERGHNWAGIIDVRQAYSFDPCKFEIKNEAYDFTPEEEEKIVGLQGALWTEMLIFPPHFAEYQLFPRLCATAEIGWTDQDKRDYEDFEKRLNNSHYERLYKMGIRFRLPYPEVKASGNVVTAAAPFASAVVRYSTDGSEPTINSPVVCGPIIAQKQDGLRFATFFADVQSISVGVEGSVKYLEPKVKVTVSEGLGEHKSHTVAHLEDYDFNSYYTTGRPVKKGDFILYAFDEPVKCSSIEVISTIPRIEFYGVADGHVEYSFDGKEFIRGEIFRYGKALIKPEAPVKAVKILFDGKGECKTVAIQDLRIRE